MTRTRFAGLALLGLAAALMAGPCPAHQKHAATPAPAAQHPGKVFNRAFANRIRLGMKIDKVEAIIGDAGNDLHVPLPGIARQIFWIGSDHSNFAVDLNDNDEVIGWNVLQKDGKAYGMDAKGKITGPL